MDIHGTEDDIIPANVSNGDGPGPHGSTISADGFYYTPTDAVMEKWASKNECSGEPYQYVTEVRTQTRPHARTRVHMHTTSCTHTPSLSLSLPPNPPRVSRASEGVRACRR